jgi:hypothetical protein
MLDECLEGEGVDLISPFISHTFTHRSTRQPLSYPYLHSRSNPVTPPTKQLQFS